MLVAGASTGRNVLWTMLHDERAGIGQSLANGMTYPMLPEVPELAAGLIERPDATS